MYPIPSSLTSLINLEPHGKPKLTPSEHFAENLRAIGGISVEEFLSISESDLPPIRYDHGFANATSPWYYTASNAEIVDASPPGQKLQNAKDAPGKAGVCSLEGNTETLGDNGSKVHAAEHIVKDESQRTHAGLELAAAWDPVSPEDETDPVKIIDNYFIRYRPGLRPPRWFTYENGAVLRVQVSRVDKRAFRVYSTPENTPSEPKRTCAQIAIDNGVLEFIKSYQSQARLSADPLTAIRGNVGEDNEGEIWASIEDFMKTLPRPLPEAEFETNPDNAEKNIMSWFNTLFQVANKHRASPLQQHYHTLLCGQRHGNLLRIEDPNSDPKQAKSYLAEPRFSKKKKAKVAVCLQAMSDGIGDFFRSFIPGKGAAVTSVDTKTVPESMHHHANKVIWPQLMTACQEIDPKMVPAIHYMSCKGKIGCTLKISVPPLPGSNTPAAMLNKNGEISRKYTVPAEYSSNEDARAAVLYEAGQKKVVQLVKHRGNPPKFNSSGSGNPHALRFPPVGYVSSFGPYGRAQNLASSASGRVWQQPRYGQTILNDFQPTRPANEEVEPGEIVSEEESSESSSFVQGVLPDGERGKKRKRDDNTIDRDGNKSQKRSKM
ncbi:hypothetical protein D9757_009330 [Collybiopsis confluens]|uniref:Uncharacterized protein n=1 Tax=Collybiopsis confluens TaxID=2823264 RepID=A0A8H5H430_9AGAR|nr:hypothetical protein D9757_009330 [Collybiopsis confluens]